ncbi:MAG: ribosome maturation factor RimP [Cyanobacteria bacterium SIG27]|nr:ribosome maturation factor RimP [Cyanobacteria bacterium SIG27]
MKEFTNKRELIETITPVVENTAMRYGLIPLEILFERENNRHFLRIFIYSPDHNVSHLDCENMSRGLGDMLDELIPFKYFLEVSSPGLDRKFKSEKEYIVFKGHDVIIKLKNSVDGISEKTFEAKLLDYNEAFGIKIEIGNQEFIIPMEKIHSTRLNDKIEINKNKGEKDD